MVWLAMAACLAGGLLVAQEEIERYRLGNIVEASTYCSTGSLAGKAAVVDGYNFYLYDIAAGTYTYRFNFGDLGFGAAPRGLVYISEGDYEGNFLVNDISKDNILYIFTPDGNNIGQVEAVDFQWEIHCEGMTFISSGDYEGSYAMIGFTENWVPHIFIFRIEEENGTLKAYLDLDIQNADINSFPLGLTHLPGDYTDPAVQNHLLISDLNPDPADGKLYLRAISQAGNLTAKWEITTDFEGLAYISGSSESGKIFVTDHMVRVCQTMNPDGSDTVHHDIQVGLGLGYYLRGIAWHPANEQYVMGRYDITGPEPRYTSPILSRSGKDQWNLDTTIDDLGLRYFQDVTVNTVTGDSFMTGYNIDPNTNTRLVEVLQLDPDYNIINSTPLQDRYFIICHIPGATTAEDRFAMVSFDDRQTIVFFNNDFEPVDQINLGGSLERIADICFDASRSRFYVLDNLETVHLFDSSWNLFLSYDMSGFSVNVFADLEKISTGNMKGNLVLLDPNNSELVFVSLTKKVVKHLLEELIAEVLASDIHHGTQNSLLKKLQNSLKSFEKGNVNVASNKLNGFINNVLAQRGKKIPETLADEWIAKAEAIIAELTDL